MSRRTNLYRKHAAVVEGKLDVGETTHVLQRNHRMARDEDGRICSLPIKTEKAQRLAQRICSPRVRQ